MNKKTVELDLYKREQLKKELFFHVICLRDIRDISMNELLKRLYTVDEEYSVKKSHIILGYTKGVFENNLPYK